MDDKLSARMERALLSTWTDREGVRRIDSGTRIVTKRALQARGFVKPYSHELTGLGVRALRELERKMERESGC